MGGKMIDLPEIEAAARWLAGQWEPPWPMYLPADDVRRDRLLLYRRTLIEIARKGNVVEMPDGMKLGMADVSGPGPGLMALVTVYPGRCYGYLGDEVRPSFVWPEAEAQRLRRRWAERDAARRGGR